MILSNEVHPRNHITIVKGRKKGKDKIMVKILKSALQKGFQGEFLRNITEAPLPLHTGNT